MQYDPIKQSLSRFFNRSVFLRRVFFQLLDLLLLRTWHIHKELRRFMRHKQGVRQVLDAGSGFGQYTYFLSRKQASWNIHAVDLKEDEIAASKTFFDQAGIKNVVFEVEDLTGFVRPHTYDLILSVDVMEHIEEDEQVFQNFFRSLKKNGLLLISTPSDRGGSGVTREEDTSFIDEHVRDGYGAKEMAQKLKKAGFQRVETRYTYGKPGKISWQLSMRAPITLIGASKFFLILLPLYYLLVMPFVLLLNLADVHLHHKSGTGLLVKAWKA